MRSSVAARRLWTSRGVVQDATVVLDDDVITELRPWVVGDGVRLDGLVVPGLINAHTHVELSDLAGKVRGATPGFLPWLSALWSAERSDATAAGAEALHAACVAYVVDVSNRGDTAAAIAAARLRGVVQHERLGFDARAVRETIAAMETEPPGAPGVAVRAAPHALFSTAPELVTACVRAGESGLPSTIHVGEAEDEARFLMRGDGPFAELLDRLGRDWRWWTAPGTDAVDVLAACGVLGPELLLVHGVHLGAEAIAKVSRAGAPICFCPRSNLHIGGRLPDVEAWMAAGVRCVLGTDSLASSPDLDVLGEIPALMRAFPEADPGRWLAMVTHEAAAVLGVGDVGEIRVGGRPGLVELDVRDVRELGKGAPGRRWVGYVQ